MANADTHAICSCLVFTYMPGTARRIAHYALEYLLTLGSLRSGFGGGRLSRRHGQRGRRRNNCQNDSSCTRYRDAKRDQTEPETVLLHKGTLGLAVLDLVAHVRCQRRTLGKALNCCIPRASAT